MDQTEQTALNIIWGHIVDRIRKSGALSAVACDQWLATVTPLSLEDTKLTLGTPNGFILKWIKDRYTSHLEKAAFDIVGEKCTIYFHNLDLTPKEAPLPDLPMPKGKHRKHKAKPTPPDMDAPVQTTLMDSFQGVDENLPADIDAIATEAMGLPPEPEETYAVHDPVDRVAPGDTSSLNPKYTFDTFVTGNSNRFAHAAALAVAKSPGKIYNPFFLYGGVGLGKTHLMHAIGHEILKNFPDKRVLYVSSEKFTNELINAIKDGEPESFRQKYRTIDVLLVDDIQFLSKKPSTQEEFFHTFNTLHDAGHAIILSSDRAPSNVEHLAERLRSRFEWGLTADVQAPDFETRIAILKKKAQLDNLNVPNEVMVSIANSIDTNIRELEGALTRIVAYASITHQPITVAVAEKTIENLFPKNRSRRVTPELIKNVVANHYKIQVSDLDSKNRSRNIVYPRNVAIYLCREMTDSSFPQIGSLFGGKDHSTILHAYNKIKNTMQSDQSMNNTIQKLIDQIQNS